jgi:hypothetical protein
LFVPDFGDVVDEFGAIIAVELQNWDEDGSSDIRESPERPVMSVSQEGTKFSDFSPYAFTEGPGVVDRIGL